MAEDRFNHLSPEWPNYRIDWSEILPLLVEAHRRQAAFAARLGSVGFDFRERVGLGALTQEIAKSSEIEGERLSYRSIRTSISRRLSPTSSSNVALDRDVEGPVEITLDAVQRTAYRRAPFRMAPRLFPRWYERAPSDQGRRLA